MDKKPEQKKELTYKGVPLTDEEKANVQEQVEYMLNNPAYLKYVAESIAEKKRNNLNN